MSPPLEITRAPCATVHCTSATKMASVKRVTDEPASRLTVIGANLLCFKIRQVSLAHPVYSSQEKEAERRRGMSKAEITRERKTVDWKTGRRYPLVLPLKVSWNQDGASGSEEGKGV